MALQYFRPTFYPVETFCDSLGTIRKHLLPKCYDSLGTIRKHLLSAVVRHVLTKTLSQKILLKCYYQNLTVSINFVIEMDTGKSLETFLLQQIK